MSLVSKPYANQTMALNVRKKDSETGMNSTLFVRITSLCTNQIMYRVYKMYSP